MSMIPRQALRVMAILFCAGVAPGGQRPASQFAGQAEDLSKLPPPQCEPLIRGVLWWVHPTVDGPRVREIFDAMDAVGRVAHPLR